MDIDFVRTQAYENIMKSINAIVNSIKSEVQVENQKYIEELDIFAKLVRNTPLSIEKGRYTNPNVKIIFKNIPYTNEYLKNSFGNAIRTDYGTGHELNYFCYCLTEHYKGNLKINEVSKLLIKYFQVIKEYIGKFNVEPAGSKGGWTLDSFQLLPFVIGTAEACNEMQDWFNEILQEIRTPVSVRLFNRKWDEVNKEMIVMYSREVLERRVVTKSFIYSAYLPRTYIK